MFAQIMQVGRITHPTVLPKGQPPLAPSAIRPEKTKFFNGTKFLPLETPKELDQTEIASQLDAYGKAAERAVAAGFDGCELHAASGYLPNQFFSASSNKRTDQWGGSPKNRVRFAVEALKRMIQVRGPEHVGIKISPLMNFNDIAETPEECKETYAALIDEVNKLAPAYVHIMTANPAGFDALSFLRPLVNKKITVIAGAGYDAAKATKAIDEGRADLVAFGMSFLANPDLPKRLEQGLPLNKPVQIKFYSAGPDGYIDYPFVGQQPQQQK
jgi:N-ethylmaleimide reductase